MAAIQLPLPGSIVTALRAVGTNAGVDELLVQATRDPATGTYTVTVPDGMALALRNRLHDAAQHMADQKPAARMAVYQRLFDKAIQRLLAA